MACKCIHINELTGILAGQIIHKTLNFTTTQLDVTYMNTPRKKNGLRNRKVSQGRSNAKVHHDGALLVSVAQSTRLTGLGLTLSYKMVRDGTLPSVEINGRRYIHVPALMERLNRLAGTEGAA
jgi:hypothetical protein